MTAPNNLIDWYLAWLRKRAQPDRNPDQTPMTLLESDEALVRQIVESEVKRKNPGPVARSATGPGDFLWKLMLTLSILGTAILVILSIFIELKN